MRTLAVLRPEPGNAATCARIAAAGATALALPLFVVRALPWTPPAAGRFDALFLTSANAARHAGAALAKYCALPVFAVGPATARAARDVGLSVAATGEGDAAALAILAAAQGVRRALHLAGRERAQADLPNVVETVAVYASEARDIANLELDRLAGCVALVHSPRAAARLAQLAPDRAAVRIAAISGAALAAAGTGWAASLIAGRPSDEALVAAALALADRPRAASTLPN